MLSSYGTVKIAVRLHRLWLMKRSNQGWPISLFLKAMRLNGHDRARIRRDETMLAKLAVPS
jgi:hypothetical protein